MSYSIALFLEILHPFFQNFQNSGILKNHLRFPYFKFLGMESGFSKILHTTPWTPENPQGSPFHHFAEVWFSWIPKNPENPAGCPYPRFVGFFSTHAWHNPENPENPAGSPSISLQESGFFQIPKISLDS